MVGSWALVEVPRYLFYAVKEVTEKVIPKVQCRFIHQVPFPLFWLRYNLFVVLYPSGITGEIFQILCYLPALKQQSM